MDLVATPVDVVLGVAELLQLLHGLLEHVALVAAEVDVVLRPFRQGFGELVLCRLGFSDRPHVHQAVDHVLPAALHLRSGVAVREAELGGLLDGCGEERRLIRREVADILVVVGFRGRLDAVGVPSEVDGVEVLLQDPLLALGAVDLERDDDLLEFALDGLLLAEPFVVVADELLGDGGSALELLSSDGGPHRTRRTGDGHARLVPEPAVLRGEDGVLDVLGNLVEGDRFTVDAAFGED